MVKLMRKKQLEQICYYKTMGHILLGLPESSPLELLEQAGISFDEGSEDEFFCLHYEVLGRQGLPYHSAFWSSEDEMNFFRSHLFSFFEGDDEFKKRPEFKKESPDHIAFISSFFLIY